jgi:hypothetical protein
MLACGIGLAEAAAANWRRRTVGKPAYFHHRGAEAQRTTETSTAFARSFRRNLRASAPLWWISSRIQRIPTSPPRRHPRPQLFARLPWVEGCGAPDCSLVSGRPNGYTGGTVAVVSIGSLARHRPAGARARLPVASHRAHSGNFFALGGLDESAARSARWRHGHRCGERLPRGIAAKRRATGDVSLRRGANTVAWNIVRNAVSRAEITKGPDQSIRPPCHRSSEKNHPI